MIALKDSETLYSINSYHDPRLQFDGPFLLTIASTICFALDKAAKSWMQVSKAADACPMNLGGANQKRAARATPPPQTFPNYELSWKRLKALEVESVLSEQLSKTLWTTVDGENCAICLDRDSTPPTKFQPLVPDVNTMSIMYWPCVTRSGLLVWPQVKHWRPGSRAETSAARHPDAFSSIIHLRTQCLRNIREHHWNHLSQTQGYSPLPYVFADFCTAYA